MKNNRTDMDIALFIVWIALSPMIVYCLYKLALELWCVLYGIFV